MRTADLVGSRRIRNDKRCVATVFFRPDFWPRVPSAGRARSKNQEWQKSKNETCFERCAGKARAEAKRSNRLSDLAPFPPRRGWKGRGDRGGLQKPRREQPHPVTSPGTARQKSQKAKNPQQVMPRAQLRPAPHPKSPAGYCAAPHSACGQTNRGSTWKNAVATGSRRPPPPP